MQGNILNRISLLCLRHKNQQCGTVNPFIVCYKPMDALHFRQLCQPQEHSMLLGLVTAFWKEHYTNSFGSMFVQ